ncbi:hypothetical protein [Sphingomonas lenta]|uniref:hypothetical protein n=1 Tax=Sphingomonas lenta TaxID=1141887 RepID=UPI001595DE95|nr:hypothetical protein [Sphingomonas lenta]
MKAIVAAAALIVPLGAAYANTRAYNIDANTRESFNLRLCGPAVTVTADGDDDTDLDYWLYNSAGQLVHRDLDRTDMMIRTIYRRDGSCGNYRLVVRNLGDIYNRMQLSLDDLA